jgi:hypothetical protein
VINIELAEAMKAMMIRDAKTAFTRRTEQNRKARFAFTEHFQYPTIDAKILFSSILYHAYG